jgi:hypothetical protein
MKEWMVAVFLLASLFIGCAAADVPESVCDRIPPGEYSVICRLADRLGQSPEQVSAVLRVANLAGLASDAYTARQARVFIVELQEFLQGSTDRGLTYAGLLDYATGKYLDLPPEVQASLIVLRSVGGLRAPELEQVLLSGYDYRLLEAHLDEQMRLVTPFLTGE